jgi:hypothetical protein
LTIWPWEVELALQITSVILWVRIGFRANPDLDLAFNVNADPDPGHTLPSLRDEFLHKKILYVGNAVGHTTYLKPF